MKQKIYLFLVTAILLSLLCAPAVCALPEENDSMERGGETTIEADAVPLLELPAAEIRLRAAGDQRSGAVFQVPHEQIQEAIAQVNSGDVVRITAVAGGNSEQPASRVSTVLRKESLAEVAERTDVELEVASGLGKVIFPNAAISSLAETAAGDDVELLQKEIGKGPGNSEEDQAFLEKILNSGLTLTEAQIQESPVTTAALISNGEKITDWGGEAIRISLPAGMGDYEAGKCYQVFQFDEDMNMTEHAGYCVMGEDGSLQVEVSVTQLGAFVALAEEAAESVKNEPVPMVASPLVALTDTGDSEKGMVYAGGAVVLALAAAAAGTVLKRREKP